MLRFMGELARKIGADAFSVPKIKTWKVPIYKGQVGFATLPNEHICSTCNGLRITADKSLKMCLYNTAEVSPCEALMHVSSEDGVIALIRAGDKRKNLHFDTYKSISYIMGFNDLLHLSSKPFITSMRCYSSNTSDSLTHVNEEGNTAMVDVTPKENSTRTATARAVVKVGCKIAQLISENLIKKGDVLSVAQIAGIIGAKKTFDVIPLCHNIPLTKVKVTAELDKVKEIVVINATVICQGKTGVEIEALTAVAISALTVYDMCKAVSHDMEITDIVLLSKSGGSKGIYKKEGEIWKLQ